ncbi:MAG: carbamoyltransferase HypF [Deltaproteobacteria bacterium]|nr:carbamoyltransferase HypF [Deltaproteobacteria bacterium]
MGEGSGPARQRFRVRGLVQGVGFRPFVYRLALAHGLAGWVRNTSRGVEIEAEGPATGLERFGRALAGQAPPLARVEEVITETALPLGETAFLIQDSRALADTEAVIPPDVGTCVPCFGEVSDPRDRRHAYPFTNCTNCGPRFTLIREVPYDRRFTTMAAFAMCPECRREYLDPRDRRFHAEPTACPACGPRLWLEDREGRRWDDDVPAAAGRLLQEGKIVAVKGLGGFHLACDARRDEAVRTLRERKGRVAKPFAVMVRDLEEAGRLCHLSDRARALLLSPEAPIVLAPRRPGARLSAHAAPGNRYLGLLLPYTPLHFLLFRHAPAALVMTSGNLSEEPLVFTNEGARTRLAALADAFLLHDRDIQAPCDDSVVRPLEDGGLIVLRRARGYVPRTIALPLEVPEVLGVGAEQKSTFCLGWGRTALLSQHLGDLDNLETFVYFSLAVKHFQALSRKAPRLVAHDLHPDYLSTRYAAASEGRRTVGVQHHHAHLAACLAEHGRTDRCLGVALDGTGFGPDGTVWGGEILLADLAGFQRVGHFAPVRLPGGEAAIRLPVRMAAAYLHAVYGEAQEEVAARLGIAFPPLEAAILRRQSAGGLNTLITTSAGRLFDAVAAAIGVCRERTYEGQPALELEMAADPREGGCYPAALHETDGRFILDTPALFRGAVEDRLAGVEPAVIAARFHHSLIRLLAETCRRLREVTGLNLAALSGGVFQNGLLAVGLRQRLETLGFEVLTHSQVPPNDGGISLGQVAVAGARRQAEK